MAGAAVLYVLVAYEYLDYQHFVHFIVVKSKNAVEDISEVWIATTSGLICGVDGNHFWITS